MAVFINVAAGMALEATGEAAEMMRTSPAYKEITGDDAQGMNPAVATAISPSAEETTGGNLSKAKSARKRKRAANPKQSD